MILTHRFCIYYGELMGLKVTRHHLVFKWDAGNVLFSVARRGNAASCHFSSDQNSLRRLKQAIEEFIAFVFDLFEWCTMILAMTEKGSVARLCERLGFSYVGCFEELSVYERLK